MRRLLQAAASMLAATIGALALTATAGAAVNPTLPTGRTASQVFADVGVAFAGQVYPEFHVPAHLPAAIHVGVEGFLIALPHGRYLLVVAHDRVWNYINPRAVH